MLPAMHLLPITVYRTPEALVAERGGEFRRLSAASLDSLFTAEAPAAWLDEQFSQGEVIRPPGRLLAPIGSQEVWAAGVTYLRSRDARMDESKEAGGGSFYDRVYDATRPELFFKATPHRVSGPGEGVKLRADSKWNVPEPELALAVDSRGRIFGYTVGNDMSSRDIEGENPLYLPQAKVYSRCCGLGPAIVVREPLPVETEIRIEIDRGGARVFNGAINLDQMKRQLPELAEYLFRDNDFPAGCFLLTGTGIVPPNDFTLASGDEIRISIAGVGVLLNPVA